MMDSIPILKGNEKDPDFKYIKLFCPYCGAYELSYMNEDEDAQEIYLYCDKCLRDVVVELRLD